MFLLSLYMRGEEIMLVDVPIVNRDDKEFQITLEESIEVDTHLHGFKFSEGNLRLSRDGKLQISKGFKWNGATPLEGRTTARMFEPTMVHDALYIIMRKANYNEDFRKLVDKDFYNRLLRSGINKKIAYPMYLIVRTLGPVSIYLKWWKD